MTTGIENIEDFPEIDEALKNVPKETEIYIQHSLSIPEYVSIKLGGKPQKYIADELKITQEQVSKWLSGSSNMTLRTISKLEAVLDIQIINPDVLKTVKKHFNVFDTPVVEMEAYKYESAGRATSIVEAQNQVYSMPVTERGNHYHSKNSLIAMI